MKVKNDHRVNLSNWKEEALPVEALIFFRLLLSHCLNWKIYCDDHSSLFCCTLFADLQLPAPLVFQIFF